MHCRVLTVLLFALLFASPAGAQTSGRTSAAEYEQIAGSGTVKQVPSKAQYEALRTSCLGRGDQKACESYASLRFYYSGSEDRKAAAEGAIKACAVTGRRKICMDAAQAMASGKYTALNLDRAYQLAKTHCVGKKLAFNETMDCRGSSDILVERFAAFVKSESTAAATQAGTEICDLNLNVGVCDWLAVDEGLRALNGTGNAVKAVNWATKGCSKEFPRSCMIRVWLSGKDGAPSLSLKEQVDLAVLTCGNSNEQLWSSCRSAIGAIQGGGEGVAKDEARALSLMGTACKAKDALACAAKGAAHYQGLGAPRNLSLAWSEASHACGAGIEDACALTKGAFMENCKEGPDKCAKSLSSVLERARKNEGNYRLVQ